MMLRSPLARRNIGVILTLAGLGYLLYAYFGRFADLDGDKHRLFYTVGAAFMVLGPVFAFTGRRVGAEGVTPQVSGIRLIIVSAILFGLSFLFANNKGQTYLMATLLLTSTLLALVGILRIVADRKRRR